MKHVIYGDLLSFRDLFEAEAKMSVHKIATMKQFRQDMVNLHSLSYESRLIFEDAFKIGYLAAQCMPNPVQEDEK